MLPAKVKLEARSNQEESGQVGWKAFESNTEAGRMLQKLYGNQQKVSIKYPVVKTKKREMQGAFVPGGGKVDNATTRKDSIGVSNSERVTKVPVFKGKPRGKMHAIDYYPIRRKRHEDIQEEMNRVKERMNAYRPAGSFKNTGKHDKEKLQQLHTYAPGTVLPNELLPGSALLDRELQSKSKKNVKKTKRQELEQMFDAVNLEIVERKQHMQEMAEFGKFSSIQLLQREIDDRVLELQRIDAMIRST